MAGAPLLLLLRTPPKAATLTDNFTTLDLTKFSVSNNSANVSVVGGQLSITNGGFTYWQSTNFYDLTGSYFRAELINDGANQSYLTVGYNPNMYYVEVQGNNVRACGHENSGSSVTYTTLTQAAANHRFVGLREAAGTVYWEYSSDGVTWNVFHTRVSAVSLTSQRLGLQGGGGGGSQLFDNVNVVAAVGIAPAGLASTNAFGTAVVARGAVALAPAGLASTNAFGTAAVARGAVALSPVGLASTNAFGVAAVAAGAVALSPVGLASSNAFGTAVVAPGAVALSPVGLASTNAFGVAAMAAGAVALSPLGLASSNAFGIATVTALAPGAVALAPAGLASTNAFGTVVVARGAVALSPAGLASTNAFGVAAVAAGAVALSPLGLASTNAFGVAAVAAGAVALSPVGLVSTNAFGTAVVFQGAFGVVVPGSSGVASGDVPNSPIPNRFILDQYGLSPYNSETPSGDPRFYVMCFTNQTGLLTVSESEYTIRFEAAKAVDMNVSVIQVENLTIVVKGSLCPGG